MEYVNKKNEDRVRDFTGCSLMTAAASFKFIVSVIKPESSQVLINLVD